jgi:hypothetical protein
MGCRQQKGNRMSNAIGASRQPRRCGIVALATTALIAGLTLTAATGSATAKVQNLAGNYSGTTSEGNSVTFRITKKGKVVNFAGVVNLGNSVLGHTDPCYGMGLTATVTAPHAVRLTKPVPGYPKGKRFDYQGPGGNPPADHGVIFQGEVTSGTNFAGSMLLNGLVPTPLGNCGESGPGTKEGGRKFYTARKVG